MDSDSSAELVPPLNASSADDETLALLLSFSNSSPSNPNDVRQDIDSTLSNAFKVMASVKPCRDDLCYIISEAIDEGCNGPSKIGMATAAVNGLAGVGLLEASQTTASREISTAWQHGPDQALELKHVHKPSLTATEMHVAAQEPAEGQSRSVKHTSIKDIPGECEASGNKSDVEGAHASAATQGEEPAVDEAVQNGQKRRDSSDAKEVTDCKSMADTPITSIGKTIKLNVHVNERGFNQQVIPSSYATHAQKEGKKEGRKEK